MDQFSTNNESSSFQLPEVQQDSKEVDQQFESSVKSTNEHSMAKAVEQNNTTNQLSNNPAQFTQSVPVNPLPINNPATMVQANKPTQIVVTDSLTASDTDLIEKAWVVKAKEIVNQTKNDPFGQTNEIKKIRNDYQTKRFKTNLKSDRE